MSIINERLQAAFEPTNLDLFNLENLQTKLKDITDFMKYQHLSNADYLQLRDYKILIEQEIKNRLK